nr:uncharacterized protein LOC127320980 isoform X3 [Lolium perenne]
MAAQRMGPQGALPTAPAASRSPSCGGGGGKHILRPLPCSASGYRHRAILPIGDDGVDATGGGAVRLGWGGRGREMVQDGIQGVEPARALVQELADFWDWSSVPTTFWLHFHVVCKQGSQKVSGMCVLRDHIRGLHFFISA